MVKRSLSDEAPTTAPLASEVEGETQLEDGPQASNGRPEGCLKSENLTLESIQRLEVRGCGLSNLTVPPAFDPKPSKTSGSIYR